MFTLPCEQNHQAEIRLPEEVPGHGGITTAPMPPQARIDYPMQALNCDHAHYYNKKYSCRGPLFSDRYTSIDAQDQLYLEQLIRHISLNPIRDGIFKN